MLATALVFGSFMTVLFCIVGVLIGWTAREYMLKYTHDEYSMHPEMYDENGNILPDQLIAFRFESPDDYDYEED